MTKRFTSSIYKWSMHRGTELPASPKALADLERRRALGPRADLTGQLLGDPPPGRSALDRKREAEEREAAGQQQQDEEHEA